MKVVRLTQYKYTIYPQVFGLRFQMKIILVTKRIDCGWESRA